MFRLLFTALIIFQSLGFASSKVTRSSASVSSGMSTSSLTAGVSLPILPDSGETAFGINLGYLTEVASKVYFGADMGLHFWGNDGAGSVTGLQLLPTAVYQFKSGTNWLPYIGLSAGPYLYVSKPAGNPGVDFALFFRPGINWKLSQALMVNLEAKYGELGGALMAQPVVSLAFSL